MELSLDDYLTMMTNYMDNITVMKIQDNLDLKFREQEVTVFI